MLEKPNAISIIGNPILKENEYLDDLVPDGNRKYYGTHHHSSAVRAAGLLAVITRYWDGLRIEVKLQQCGTCYH